MSKQDLEDEKMLEVPATLVRQAIALMSYDAMSGYRANRTPYADRRHGTSRALADYTDIDYTDYPEIRSSFPKELYDGLEFDGGV